MPAPPKLTDAQRRAALEKAAEQNKKDKKAWMTANPGMLVTDPIYQFN